MFAGPLPNLPAMPRDIDERKKRKALRKLRRAALLAEQGLGPELSDWEKQFLEEVEARIETYGSAFADPEKGGADEPLSALQTYKLREIDKKARGKTSAGFKSRRRPPDTPPVPALESSENPVHTPSPPPSKPTLVRASDLPAAVRTPTKGKPKLRVIKGGADD